MEQTCIQCNKLKNIIHTCCNCRYNICRNCLRKYLLSTYLLVCPNNGCNYKVTKSDIVKIFGQNWCNNVYWNYIETNHMDKIDINKLDEFRMNIKHLYTDLERANQVFDKKYQILYTNINDIRHALIEIRYTKSNIIKNQTCLFINCPKSDCRGMIPVDKKEKAKCAMCDTILCKKCLECIHSNNLKFSEEEHICNPDILENVQTIFKDTKQCPGCGISIYKIEGCYQMWCTQCHTTFHYRTGEVLNEHIHNPHYIEWLNHDEKRRNVEEIMAEHHGLNYPTITRISNAKSDSILFVQQLLRLYFHIIQMELPAINTNMNDNYNSEMQNERRAYYIMNKWSQDFYKEWLYKQDRLFHKNNHLLVIYIKASRYLEKILTEYINNMEYKLKPINLNNEFDKINTESIEYSKLYENKFPQFVFDETSESYIIKHKMEKLRMTPSIAEKDNKCQVCVNKFNKTIRKKVTCQDCNYTMCTQCGVKYLLDSINEPCCMNCKKEWTRTNLVTYFGMHMYTYKFKPHRKEVLFEREKIRIPETMERVEKLKLIDLIMTERSKLYKELTVLENEYKKERDDLYKKIKYIKTQILEIKQLYLPD